MNAAANSFIPLILPGLSAAEALTWDLDKTGGDDRRWRRRMFKKLPDEIAESVANLYRGIWLQGRPRDANRLLHHAAEKLQGPAVKLGWDDAAIIRFSEEKAERCRWLAKACANIQAASEAASRYALCFGFMPPAIGKDTGPLGALLRLQDPIWWRRAVRRAHARAVEAKAIELGLVNRHAGCYVSDNTLKRRRSQKLRTRRLLGLLEAENELGDVLPLQELADSSVSNPANRRNELMARMAGFDRYALERSDTGLMITLTCPSRMHAWLSESGKINPRYDSTIPSKAQRYLTNMWAKIRTALSRREIRPYGFRIVEPHQDGTPHWHLLLFVKPSQTETLCNLCRSYALAENSNEPGAQGHRFKVVKIDRRKGTATGYIAKYVSKNIDGHGLAFDDFSDDSSSSAERVEAWASTWGIRQFQQIGGPPVTLWRKLRKLRNGAPGKIGELAEAADNGDWAEYIRLMGGPGARRNQFPVTAHKVWNDQLGRYGEPIGWQILGVQKGNIIIPTRIHVWRIRSARNCASSNMLFDSWHQGENAAPMDAKPIRSRYAEFPAQTPKYFLNDDQASKEQRLTPLGSVNNCTARREAYSC